VKVKPQLGEAGGGLGRMESRRSLRGTKEIVEKGHRPRERRP